MSTIAKVATGTLLKVGDGASPTEAFTTVPEVTRLSGPSIRFDLLDASSHDSGAYREWIPGFADGDSIAFSINWRPSNTLHKAIRLAAENQTRRNFKTVFPDTSDNTVLVATYIESLVPDSDPGRLLTESGRLKVTGAPTWS